MTEHPMIAYYGVDLSAVAPVTDPPIGTYAAACTWIRPEIIETIERTKPCTNSAGHLWDWDSNWVTDFAGRLVRIDHWAVCAFCKSIRTDKENRP